MLARRGRACFSVMTGGDHRIEHLRLSRAGGDRIDVWIISGWGRWGSPASIAACARSRWVASMPKYVRAAASIPVAPEPK